MGPAIKGNPLQMFLLHIYPGIKIILDNLYLVVLR